MKTPRLLVNITMASTLALLALGVQSGFLVGMTESVLADTLATTTTTSGSGANCGTFTSTPVGDDTLQVCGSYSGTVSTTVTVKVTAVTSHRVTGVNITNTAGSAGPTGTFSVDARTGAVNGGSKIFGQTYAFLLDQPSNTVGDTYSFAEKPGCKVKSKC